MKKATRGHPSVFTDAQNAALRSALRDLKKRRNYSQVALGNMLGLNQQNASRLLRDEGGFSYVSATRLTRLLGCAGVDSFFRARGVALPSTPPATGTDG